LAGSVSIAPRLRHAAHSFIKGPVAPSTGRRRPGHGGDVLSGGGDLAAVGADDVPVAAVRIRADHQEIVALLDAGVRDPRPE
jgi:hypothetical protein